MSLTFERLYPLIAAMAAAILAALLDMSFPGSESYRAGLLSAAISASAIFVGFIATAKSILMALPQGGIRQQLHDSCYIDDLVSYLNQAMGSNLAFCVLNIVGFFPAAQEKLFLFVPVWIALGAYSVLSFWRVGRAMMVILKLS